MKKIKLLATISSIFLAMALVVFGVYAARVGQMTVSSTISYQVGGNLNLEIVVTVEYNNNLVKFSDQNANKTFIDETIIPSDGFDCVNAWKITQDPADENEIDLTGENALNLGAYEFKPGVENGSCIKYTIKITNKSNYAVRLTKAEPEEVTEGAVTLSVTSEGLTGDDFDLLAGRDSETDTYFSYVFTATYVLSDNTINLETPHTFAPTYQIAGL
jgi:hypothetical protein